MSLIWCCSCNKKDEDTGPVRPASRIPDHIIFVWFENKNYSQIINSASAPYINSLIPEGTLFTNFHALGHPSYPEYIKFFSGTDNGKRDNNCVNDKPFNVPNLYTQLNLKGKSFAWYSEGLPFTGSDTCSAYPYAERHNPVTIFSNVPGSVNKTFAEFPSNYSMLEKVVCITPNLKNDMHDGSILEGDTWLKNNLKPLIDWCKTHNSVFVIYFDEDNGTVDNHIAVLAVGEPIKKNYTDSLRYNHYNMTRTILEKYSAAPIGNSINSQPITSWWR
jgi:phosphatidylinositol-3-phosphatase